MADLSTQIKDALKKAGLNEDLLDQIKVEKEEDINKAVDELKKDIKALEGLSGEDFLNAIKNAGLSEPLKKYVISEADRRVTEAITTHDAKLKAEVDKTKVQAALDKEKEGMTEDQKKLSTLVDTVDKLSITIDKFAQNTSEKDVSVSIITALKEAKLNEGFADFIHVKSVEEVGDAVKNLSEKVLAERQQTLDKKLEELNIPHYGGASTSSSDNDITEYAKKKSEQIGGGGIISKQLEDKKE